jgi:chromosome segregation ATPase
MKKIIISFAAVAMSLAMAAGAQTQSGPDPISPVQIQGTVKVGAATSAKTLEIQTKEAKPKAETENALIKAFQEKVTAAKNKLISEKASSSEAVKAKAEILKEEVKAKKEQAQERLKAEKEAFKTKIEAAKEEVKVKREQEKAALKIKLQAIKDEAKKATVQKLDDGMNKLNSNFVEKMTKSLSDFDTYLSRLADKASATSTVSRDLTVFNAAVESARIAIASARTAVEAQAKKTYNITVSTEVNLKADVSSVKNTLNSDLKSVKDLVQMAHSAVVKVLNEFNKIK